MISLRNKKRARDLNFMYTHCTHIHFISKYKYIYWIYIFFNFFLYVRSYNLYTHTLKIFVLKISKQVAIFDGIPLVYIYIIYNPNPLSYVYIYIHHPLRIILYIYIYILFYPYIFYGHGTTTTSFM